MIETLQTLRAVAVWMVVLHHMRPTLGALWPPFGETHLFASGVDIFFVLSGVVIAVSTTDSDGSAAFLARRIARVAPLYWLVTLTLTAVLALGFRPVGVADWSAGDVIRSLAFVPMIRSDGFPGPLLAVGWTLVFEAAFYALFAAALAWRRFVQPELAVVGALCGVAVFGALAQPAPIGVATWTSPLILEFAAGVVLGRLWKAGIFPKATPTTGLVAAAVSAIGLILGAGMLASLAPGGDLVSPSGEGSAWRTLCFGGPAALLVAAALVLQPPLKRRRVSPPFQIEGAASYAVYLVHLPLLQIAEKAFGQGPALLAALPVIALAGRLVHRRIERPLTAATRGLLAQTRPKSSSMRMMSSSSR